MAAAYHIDFRLGSSAKVNKPSDCYGFTLLGSISDKSCKVIYASPSDVPYHPATARGEMTSKAPGIFDGSTAVSINLYAYRGSAWRSAASSSQR